MLGASIAAIGINLLVAAACGFVRGRRDGRDWLGMLALAHLCNASVYTLAYANTGPAGFAALMTSWGGIPFLGLQIANPLLILLGVMRLQARGGRRTEATMLVAGVVLVAGLWLPRSFPIAFAGAQATALILYLAVGAWLWRGPTAFYRVVGASFAIRGIYAGVVVYLAVHRNLPVLELLIYLNVVVAAASGIGCLLIEFDDTRLKLIAADAAKTNFLANMSHELRTPLNGILGFGQVIEGAMFGPLPQRYREYAGDIVQAGSHLLGIVDQLLDMVAAQHGAHQPRLEPASLRALVLAGLQGLRDEAASRGIRLTVDLPDDPVAAVTDPQAIRRIVVNLAGNAIKFSPGGAEVRIALAARPESIAITVADHGIGISKSDQRRLFTPFWQAETARARQHQGLGLGLALTHRLVTALGGTITVESAPGAGSEFRVALPREAVAAEAGRERPSPLEGEVGNAER